jgi:hypothetical protein
MKNKRIYDGETNRKLCDFLNDMAEEEFKQKCTHPKKHLRELPNQKNIHLYNREAKCLICGAILMGYLGRDEKGGIK